MSPSRRRTIVAVRLRHNRRLARLVRQDRRGNNTHRQRDENGFQDFHCCCLFSSKMKL